MNGTVRTRSTIGAAALTVVVALGATGCATTEKSSGPSDVRVVDLSDEAAEKIAERVAAYMPQPPVTYQPQPAAARVQPVVVQPVRRPPPRDNTGAARRTPPPTDIFVPVAAVAPDRLRSAAEKAVDDALEWLSRHQTKDGAWYSAGFADECVGERCTGPGEASYTPGLTGMTLLAFLDDGNTHRSGPHKDVVRDGLRYLKSIQDSEGCFGPRVSQHFQYNHALCTLAMVKAYGATKSDLFLESAQSAVDFVQMSQNPYLGWRYGVRDGDNDTSMTSWMVMVLAEAKSAGLRVDDNAFRGAIAWVDKMTEPEFGRVGYNRRGGPPARTQEMMDAFPADFSEAITAAGLLVRLHAGQSPKSNDLIRKGSDLLAAKPPVWNVERGTNDFYYWHLGARAMRLIGGKGWTTWRNALHAAVVEHQVQGDGGAAGSWDPVDAWSPEGGRIYSTATLCLTLQQVEASLR